MVWSVLCQMVSRGRVESVRAWAVQRHTGGLGVQDFVSLVFVEEKDQHSAFPKMLCAIQIMLTLPLSLPLQ